MKHLRIRTANSHNLSSSIQNNNKAMTIDYFITPLPIVERRLSARLRYGISSRSPQSLDPDEDSTRASPLVLSHCGVQEERHDAVASFPQKEINALDWTYHSSEYIRGSRQTASLDVTLSSRVLTASLATTTDNSKCDAPSKIMALTYPPIEEVQIDRSGCFGTYDESSLLDDSTHFIPNQSLHASGHVYRGNTRRKGSFDGDGSEAAPPSVSNVRSQSPDHDPLLSACSYRSFYSESFAFLRHFHRVTIEVSPGVDAYLIGAEETLEAMAYNRLSNCACMICDNWLSCMDEASMVLCPDCYTISPVESFAGNHILTVGLGVRA
jgi:hypothetical protein